MDHFIHLKEIAGLNNELQSQELQNLLEEQLWELADKNTKLKDDITEFIVRRLDFRTNHIKHFLIRFGALSSDCADLSLALYLEHMPVKLMQVALPEGLPDLTLMFESNVSCPEHLFCVLADQLVYSRYLTKLAKKSSCVVIKLNVDFNVLSALESLLSMSDYRSQLPTIDALYSFIKLVEKLQLVLCKD